MSIGEDQVARALPPRQGRGLRISILGMLALVAAAAAAMVVYRRVSQRVFERPSLIAKYDKSAPAADGVIGPKRSTALLCGSSGPRGTPSPPSGAGCTTRPRARSLYFGRENAWNFGIKLEKRWLPW